jgi:hypothetical protein
MNDIERIRAVLAQQCGWEGLDPRGPGLRKATPQWKVDQLLMVAERNARGTVDALDDLRVILYGASMIDEDRLEAVRARLDAAPTHPGGQ